MGYELENGVYKYSDSPSKEAVAWQGYDNFPGVDEYEDKVLKAGTLLVKLEPSRSGYFMTYDQYMSRVKMETEEGASSIKLSEGLQVPPWHNDKEKQYEYRPEVSIVKLNTDLEVAYGKTTSANPEYGKGTFEQIFIAGYDGKNRENNKQFGLEELKENKSSNHIIIDSNDIVTKLNHTSIEDKQAFIIEEKHNQHLLKRNLFCYLKTKDNLIEVMNKTDNNQVKGHCKEQIKEADKYINKYFKDIKRSINKIGNLNCPTYDEDIQYLKKKINNHSITKENVDIVENKKIERHIRSTYQNIIGKVKGDLDKTIDKYDNKKLFKKTYQDNYKEEKQLFDNAKNNLKSTGISSWKQYDSEKEDFKTLKSEKVNKNKELKEVTPSYTDVYSECSKLKKEQT